MSAEEDLINLIHSEVMRVLHRSTRRTPVVVDAYDPKLHAVKLKLMPDSVEEDVITGWILLHPMQTGNKAGWYNAPNINDHGWLEFSDDDREGGTFTHAVFNDEFKPEEVKAGEVKYIHPGTQTQIYFDKDGNVTIRGMNTTDQNGGNANNNKKSQKDQDGQTEKKDNSKQTIILKKDGSMYIRDAKEQTFEMDGKDKITITDKNKDTIVMQNDKIDMKNKSGAEITIGTGNKILLKADTITLDGETHLGGTGGVPASHQGTIDSKGHTDVGNLATKVFVT